MYHNLDTTCVNIYSIALCRLRWTYLYVPMHIKKHVPCETENMLHPSSVSCNPVTPLDTKIIVNNSITCTS